MHPVLFETTTLGAFNSYGTAIVLGGMLIGPGVWWDVKQRGLATAFLYLLDLYLVLILGCFFGGRLLYVLTNPMEYLREPARLLVLDEGFVFYGAVLGVFAGLAILARRYGRPLGELCDVLATWMALSHACGRLGCWLAGCCWGAPCDPSSPVAARFPIGSVAYDAGAVARDGSTTIALHPVQLYEALGLLALFMTLLILRLRHGPERRWRQAARWVVGYGLLRVVTELFRGDPKRGYLFRLEGAPVTEALGLAADQPLLLSVSQAIGVTTAALGLWYLWRTRDRARPRHARRSTSS